MSDVFAAEEAARARINELAALLQPALQPQAAAMLDRAINDGFGTSVGFAIAMAETLRDTLPEGSADAWVAEGLRTALSGYREATDDCAGDDAAAISRYEWVANVGR
jgi:hypothetical protein